MQKNETMHTEIPFIGRAEELAILKKAIQSNEAEMVAVIGRRRVGKTFLIETAYKEQLLFSFTGSQNAPKAEQLQNFSLQLTEQSNSAVPLKVPKDWMEAFHLLITYLKSKMGDSKSVVFLDELPWIATPKSGFLRALSFFWNSWAVKNNIVVVICGSAASWMIQKVVNHKGGLHNRITRRIFLEPFTLKETGEYLKSRHIHFDRYHIVQLYMSLGGIPHYLKEVESGRTATQNIDKICFSKNGLLRDEFSRLYPSLFSHAERHIEVIRALASTWSGMTRAKLAKAVSMSNGGGLTKVLTELQHSGFISEFKSYGKKKKEKLYRLTDEYSLFFLHFIEGKNYEGADTWQHLSQTQSYKTWAGYAFENLCLKHIPSIKKALQIGGIYSVSASFYKKGTAQETGAQIDLLIDRNDQAINLIECKFHNKTLRLTKSDVEALRIKQAVFEESTKSNKQLFWCVITTFGLQQNEYSLGFVQNVLVLDDLFG